MNASVAVKGDKCALKKGFYTFNTARISGSEKM